MISSVKPLEIDLIKISGPDIYENLVSVNLDQNLTWNWFRNGLTRTLKGSDKKRSTVLIKIITSCYLDPDNNIMTQLWSSSENFDIYIFIPPQWKYNSYLILQIKHNFFIANVIITKLWTKLSIIFLKTS